MLFIVCLVNSSKDEDLLLYFVIPYKFKGSVQHSEKYLFAYLPRFTNRSKAHILKVWMDILGNLLIAYQDLDKKIDTAVCHVCMLNMEPEPGGNELGLA